MEEMKMIADVSYKNGKYYVFNEKGKEISNNWKSSLGVLIDFSDTFMLLCVVINVLKSVKSAGAAFLME